MNDQSYRRELSHSSNLGVPDSEGAQRGPSGLGGWLIVVGLGLIVQTISVALALYESVRLVTDTSPLAPAVDWTPPVLLEFLLLPIVYLAGAVLTLILFFTRSRHFPRAFIAFQSAQIALNAYWFLGVSDPPTVEELEHASWTAKATGSTCFWIVYVLVSKRVKNTFHVPRQGAAAKLVGNLTSIASTTFSRFSTWIRSSLATPRRFFLATPRRFFLATPRKFWAIALYWIVGVLMFYLLFFEPRRSSMSYDEYVYMFKVMLAPPLFIFISYWINLKLLSDD